VVNTFLFGGPRVEKLFTDIGTSHGAYEDREYKKNKKIYAVHHSEHGHELPGPIDKIVRISVNSFKGIACYQINVHVRAGHVPVDKNLYIPDHTQPCKLRSNFYAKFMDQSLGYPLPGNWKLDHLPVFDFKVENLYDLGEFYSQLRDLSAFLGLSFYPDNDLNRIWRMFMEKNHGVLAWNKCNGVLYDILSGNDRIIELDPQEQALLNALVTRCTGLEHGVLFDHDQYPTNIGQIRRHLGLVEEIIKLGNGT